jgi:hypothetical protein
VHRRSSVAHVQAGTGRPLEDVQGVLSRIPQRPQFTGRGDDRVERRDGQVSGDPARRGGDPGPDVTAVLVRLLGDQREVAFGVRVAEHQAGVGAELGFQPGQLPEPAVVRHDAPAHDERVGVQHRPAARGGPPDVSDKRRGLGLPRLMAELLITERRFWLLIHHGRPVGVEEPDPAAVHVAMALRLQRIRSVQQPERRPHAGLPSSQPEQPAHLASRPPPAFQTNLTRDMTAG